jgi:F-type H+-transporting ATPase subunit c
MDLESTRLIAGALALLPMISAGIGLGLLGNGWVQAISRNPSANDTIFRAAIIAAGLTEAIALFALVFAIIILFVV